MWSKWGGSYQVDLDGYFDETIKHVTSLYPEMLHSEFKIIDFCNSLDHRLVMDAIDLNWPDTQKEMSKINPNIHQGEKIGLSLVLNNWMIEDSKPYIYIVDDFRQLSQNWAWFARRNRHVKHELIIDTNASYALPLLNHPS